MGSNSNGKGGIAKGEIQIQNSNPPESQSKLPGTTFLTGHSTQDITENLACFLMSSVPT
jgi:hypothetical protein